MQSAWYPGGTLTVPVVVFCTEAVMASIRTWGIGHNSVFRIVDAVKAQSNAIATYGSLGSVLKIAPSVARVYQGSLTPSISLGKLARRFRARLRYHNGS